MLRKIGKSLKIFGKGGMIDLTKVRHKVLSDWYKGSLTKIMNDMKWHDMTWMIIVLFKYLIILTLWGII